ncbi:hypothetical protein FH603_5497 [Spirosoma sp. LMG 31447]|uniref:Secreted protein n=1 Tax=Spirosoma utsteinense TaxID=2585773 RepID=A0ABR6WG42_9BACT|nr:hypothetical protein [Spirosoma utsteinense]
MVNVTKHLIGTIVLCSVATVSFCQTPSPPSQYTGIKRLNEVENGNGIISNAIYEDNVLTKEYKRYRGDSTKYVADSLAHNRLIKPVLTAPTKPKKATKKASDGN